MTCCGLSLSTPLSGSRFECLFPSWRLYSGDCVTFGRWHTPVGSRSQKAGLRRVPAGTHSQFSSWLTHHNGQALPHLPHCYGDGLYFPPETAGELERPYVAPSGILSQYYIDKRSYLLSCVFYRYRGLWPMDFLDNQSRTQVEGVLTFWGHDHLLLLTFYTSWSCCWDPGI